VEIVARGDKPKRVVPPDVAAKMVAAIELEERAPDACAFYAGLRAGELAASRIEDVELFEEGRWGLLHVRQGWDKREGAQTRRAGRVSVSSRSANSSTRSSTSTCSG
jgi:integrase